MGAQPPQDTATPRRPFPLRRGVAGEAPSEGRSSLPGQMARRYRLTGGPEAMLECCRACASLLAHPVRWRRVAADVWEIDLRCPDCGHAWGEVVPTPAMRRFDDVLKQGRAEIECYLREIERVDLLERADAFIAALEAGEIVPDDFGPAADG